MKKFKKCQHPLFIAFVSDAQFQQLSQQLRGNAAFAASSTMTNCAPTSNVTVRNSFHCHFKNCITRLCFLPFCCVTVALWSSPLSWRSVEKKLKRVIPLCMLYSAVCPGVSVCVPFIVYLLVCIRARTFSKIAFCCFLEHILLFYFFRLY